MTIMIHCAGLTYDARAAAADRMKTDEEKQRKGKVEKLKKHV